MSIWDSMRAWTLAAAGQSGRQAGGSPSQGPIWLRWLRSVESGIKSFIDGPLGTWIKTAFPFFYVAGKFDKALIGAVERVLVTVLHALRGWLERLIRAQIAAVRALIALRVRQLTAMIARAVYVAETYAFGLFARERRMRVAADIRLDHEIRTRITWLHQQIEREAASAYRGQRSQQDAAITRLLDLAANLNPVLRPLVGDLITGILDLASVDDPVARIALGFLLRQVIDRLGLDKPIGDLVRGLLAGVLGQGPPRDLHAVIADLCARLAAGESQWIRFYDDGGAEVEQAGTQWQAITDWTTDAALLGLFAGLAADPAGFAAGTTAALGAIVTDTTRAVHALIGGF